MTLVILVADGARADALHAAMDTGQLPALAQLRSEGSAHTVTSVFPSVTGPAYTPFLMGLHPGRAGVPGIRWWDRARTATRQKPPEPRIRPRRFRRGPHPLSSS